MILLFFFFEKNSDGNTTNEKVGEGLDKWERTLNTARSLSLLTVVPCFCLECEESSTSPAVPCHPSVSLTLHFRQLLPPHGSPGHCQLSHPVESSFPWLATDGSLCTLEQTGRTHHPWRQVWEHFIIERTDDSSGWRQVDIFYYSQPSKGVRSPWWSLQRPVSEVTSKRQGLDGSCRRRHCQGNSQVARQGSLLWRHQWDREGSPGNTGQRFDPIRGKSSRAVMSEG